MYTHENTVSARARKAAAIKASSSSGIAVELTAYCGSSLHLLEAVTKL